MKKNSDIKIKVKLLTDSCADFFEFAEKIDCEILPLNVLLGEEEFVDDGKAITPAFIFENYKKHKNLPKTSAVNDFDFEKAFEKHSKNYDAVIYIGLSSGLSTTFANAKRASEKFSNVFVIDSLSLSTGVGLLLLKARDLINEGKSLEEVLTSLNSSVSKVQASFVIESMEFLYKGGRCSMLQYFGANLLKIKPCLNLTNGKIVAGKKYFGKQKNVISSYVRDTIQNNPNADKTRCFVTHTFGMDPELVAIAIEQAKNAGFEDVIESTAGSTITSHCGENTIGILFLNK